MQEDGTFLQHYNFGASHSKYPAQSIPIVCTCASTSLTALVFGTLLHDRAVAHSSTSHCQMGSKSDVSETEVAPCLPPPKCLLCLFCLQLFHKRKPECRHLQFPSEITVSLTTLLSPLLPPNHFPHFGTSWC